MVELRNCNELDKSVEDSLFGALSAAMSLLALKRMEWIESPENSLKRQDKKLRKLEAKLIRAGDKVLHRYVRRNPGATLTSVIEQHKREFLWEAEMMHAVGRKLTNNQPSWKQKTTEIAIAGC